MGRGAPAGAYGNLVSAFAGDAGDAGDVFSGEGEKYDVSEKTTFRETNGDDDGAFDVRLTDAGDGACRHEAATYVQQLAIFAPRVATPARLVPRLRASLFSARPALRRAAAQTLKHLCERDAGAVARAAAADGGGLEGDLLRFVDRFENGDLVAATHARRAARLLVGHASRFGDGPASAMRALAAVALWTPGGGATPTSDETSRGFAESGTRGHFRSAPKLTTRVLAAALIAEAPTAFSEKNKTETFSVADARAAVDCAYRLATAPAAALRPAGLRALRLTLASLRGREDPDANTVGNRSESETILFAAQFQAQTLSALRAAREPDAPPRCFAEGARLAATAAACGLDAGDPRAARAIRAFVREPLEAWLGEKEAKNAFFVKTSDATDASDASDASDRSDDSVEQTLVTTSSPLTRRASASCAEGIVVRLRVAALASSARLYLLESAEGDGAVGVNPPRAFSRLALKWAAVASDFAAALVDGSRVAASFPLSVVPASLRGTSAVAEDLADAWGPCLDAATRALFAREEMGADAGEEDARARKTPTRLRLGSLRRRAFRIAPRGRSRFSRPRSPRRSSAVRSSFTSWTMRTGRTRRSRSPSTRARSGETIAERRQGRRRSSARTSPTRAPAPPSPWRAGAPPTPAPRSPRGASRASRTGRFDRKQTSWKKKKTSPCVARWPPRALRRRARWTRASIPTRRTRRTRRTPGRKRFEKRFETFAASRSRRRRARWARFWRRTPRTPTPRRRRSPSPRAWRGAPVSRARRARRRLSRRSPRVPTPAQPAARTRSSARPKKKQKS